MKSQLISRLGIVLVFAVYATPAEAQVGAAVGALGEIVKKKMDQQGATITAAGGKEKGGPSSPATEKGTSPVPATLKGATSVEVVTKQEVVLDIGLDVLNSFSAGLAAEVAERDLPAKRGRCVSNLASGHEMTTLMSSRAPELERLAKSTTPEDQAELARIASELAVRRAELEVSRCGPAVAELKAGEYEAIGALGGGFTPEQYAMLKVRVAPYCEANAAGSDDVQNPKLMYSESEKTAMKARCRTLLPNLRKVVQTAPAAS